MHQAKVNCAKVIRCILAMKDRGHRAYVHVDAKKVEEKTKQLPDYGVPPELISLLPNDNAYDKMRAQQAATPVEGMKTAAAVGASFRMERPNAVVMERSSVEDGDIQLRREASLRALVGKLGHGDDEAACQAPAEHLSAEVSGLWLSLMTSAIMELAAVYLDPGSLREQVFGSLVHANWRNDRRRGLGPRNPAQSAMHERCSHAPFCCGQRQQNGTAVRAMVFWGGFHVPIQVLHRRAGQA